MSEYTSCYFRFGEYGHPAIAAYEKLDRSKIPYGGIDTRLFVTRPHVTLVSNPLLPISQVLQLETSKGVFFQYVLDSLSAVRMELSVHDLAAVLVRRYRPPSEARGLRGASGSGRGVRTLLENCCIDFSYYFNATSNNVDVKLDLMGQKRSKQSQPQSGDSSFVDLNDEELRLQPNKLSLPTCLNSPFPAHFKFPTDSCDIVTCYEDLIFCFGLIKLFLGLTVADDSPSVQPSIRKKRQQSLIELNANISKVTVEDSTSEMSLSAIISLEKIRIMVVDNVLGLHLPLLQVSIRK